MLWKMENGSYFLNHSTLIQTLHGGVWDWEVKITFVSLLITNLHCLNSNPVLVPEYKIFLDSWPKPWESLACFYTIHTLTLIKSNICPKIIWMQLWLPPFCIPPYFSPFFVSIHIKVHFWDILPPFNKGRMELWRWISGSLSNPGTFKSWVHVLSHCVTLCK